MAQGDVTLFNQFKLDVGLKLHDLNADVVKGGFVTSTTTPTASTADPRWGAGGTTNFSSNEVTPGGNYAAGGPDIVNTYTGAAGTSTFDASDTALDIAQAGANPTNARWIILYNDTDAGKRCIGFIDLGSVTDLSAGSLDITINASGLFTLS